MHTCEVCLSDIKSAIAAVKGGANSLELCANRAEGGVTPSIGLVEQCVRMFKHLGVEINVLIRPRAGNFIYDESELSLVFADINAVRSVGATGIFEAIKVSSCRNDFEKPRNCIWGTAWA